ncbi:hypothetical protein [Streptomyces sp. NPDC004284]|uniref:hypothetical protein n=1 Tax=Streptomyces sp. NPDC004284 TaxID=3364695 RepID=UPI00367B7684
MGLTTYTEEGDAEERLSIAGRDDDTRRTAPDGPAPAFGADTRLDATRLWAWSATVPMWGYGPAATDF